MNFIILLLVMSNNSSSSAPIGNIPIRRMNANTLMPLVRTDTESNYNQDSLNHNRFDEERFRNLAGKSNKGLLARFCR